VFTLGCAKVAETSNVLEAPRNSMAKAKPLQEHFSKLAISGGD